MHAIYTLAIFTKSMTLAIFPEYAIHVTITTLMPLARARAHASQN